MRLAPIFLAGFLLTACGHSASTTSSDNMSGLQSADGQIANGSSNSSARSSSDASASRGSTESPLRPGLYEVSVVETIAGAATSPDRHSEECVSADMAAHPETFLNAVSLPGCTGTTPIRDGNQVTSQLSCADNHSLSITSNLSGDSWDQSVSGASDTGSYESRETAHRNGNC